VILSCQKEDTPSQQKKREKKNHHKTLEAPPPLLNRAKVTQLEAQMTLKEKEKRKENLHAKHLKMYFFFVFFFNSLSSIQLSPIPLFFLPPQLGSEPAYILVWS